MWVWKGQENGGGRWNYLSLFAGAYTDFGAAVFCEKNQNDALSQIRNIDAGMVGKWAGLVGTTAGAAVKMARRHKKYFRHLAAVNIVVLQ